MFEVDNISFDCFLKNDGSLDGIYKTTPLLTENYFQIWLLLLLSLCTAYSTHKFPPSLRRSVAIHAIVNSVFVLALCTMS